MRTNWPFPNRNYFIPFSEGTDPFAWRENSDRFQLLNGKWEFNPISEFSVEAPVESTSIIDLLGSYLGAGILDDYEAEDYSEDKNYEVASYQDVESLEDYLVE